MHIQKNIQWTMLYQIGIALMNFLVIVSITKLLGAEGRGAIAVYNQSIALFTTFIGFSLGSGIVYFVASGKISIAQMQRVLLYFMVFVFLVLALLNAVLYFNVGNIYNVVLPSGISKQIIFYCCLHIGSTVLFLHLSSLLNAQNIFIVPLKLMFGFHAVLLLVILYSYFKPLSIDSFSFLKFSSLLFAVLTIVLLIFALFKNNSGITGTAIPIKLVKDLFTFSWLAFLCNSIQLLSYRVDIWYLNFYFPTHSNWIGVYSIAVLFVQTLWILPNAFANIFYTKFSENKDQNAMAKKVATLSNTFLWLFGLLFFITWINAYWLMPLLFGKAFIVASNYFGLLMLGAIPIASALVISTYNASTHNLKTNLIASIIGLIICIVLNPILIPKYQVYGACAVSILAYCANAIYLYFMFLKQHKHVKISDLFLPNFSNFKNLKSTINEL